ncbi:Cation efflux family protein [Trichuris trichiura]|uniref:Cation efflux family protein n=1 Tax=Trichuris trichiura TaxID=36087 RepID=A0A077ZIP7_TRITR|nr:Cation efflux family protein [Trichuris trichiura]
MKHSNSIDSECAEYFEEAARRAPTRAVRRYYHKQAKLMRSYGEDKDSIVHFEQNYEKHGETESRKQNESLKKSGVRLAKVTFSVNLILLAVKATAGGLSGSLSVISSVVDSGMDIASGVIIWISSRAIRKRDLRSYPRGRTRLEPLSLVIISFIMGSASVQVIFKSVNALIYDNVKPDIGITTISIMAATVITKFVLWLVCRFYKDCNTRILAQDHRNDCISNASAIVCAYLGSHFWSYLDPIGAILISLYLSGSWMITGIRQMRIISGKAANPLIQSQITKICIDHEPKFERIETVLAYHFGTNYLVEVHVVLNENITLKEAHDISEGLQRKIEHLPYVERAFVHVDYEFEHRPEYEHKIV